MLKGHREISEQLDAIGVNSSFEKTRKHTKITISYRDESFTYHCSSSPSDFRAIRNIIADVKRWMRTIDANKGFPKSA